MFLTIVPLSIYAFGFYKLDNVSDTVSDRKWDAAMGLDTLNDKARHLDQMIRQKNREIDAFKKEKNKEIQAFVEQKNQEIQELNRKIQDLEIQRQELLERASQEQSK